MIVSRTLARARIARGERPGWVAAWGPVVVDFVAVSLYALAVYSALIGWIWRAQPPGWIVYTAAFALIFVPMQVVLILSALWAAKSRWQDDAGNRSAD